MTNHEALEAVETIDSLSIRSRSSNRNPISIRRAASMRVIADLALTQIRRSSPAALGLDRSGGGEDCCPVAKFNELFHAGDDLIESCGDETLTTPRNGSTLPEFVPGVTILPQLREKAVEICTIRLPSSYCGLCFAMIRPAILKR